MRFHREVVREERYRKAVERFFRGNMSAKLGYSPMIRELRRKHRGRMKKRAGWMLLKRRYMTAKEYLEARRAKNGQ